MGVRSSSGKFGIGKQSAQGTAATSFKWMRYTDVAVHPVPEEGVQIAGGGDGKRINTYLAAFKIEGDASLDCNAHWLTRLSAYAIGSDTTGNPDSTCHSLTFANTIPWVTLKRTVDDDFDETIVDCKLVGLAVTVEHAGKVTATATFLGTSFSQGVATSNAVSYNDAGTSEARTLLYRDTTQELDSVEVTNWKSLTLNIARNAEGVPQGRSPLVATIHEGNPEITGEIAFNYEGATEYKKLLTGSATGTALDEDDMYKGTYRLVIWDNKIGQGWRCDIGNIRWLTYEVGLTGENAPIESVLTWAAEDSKNDSKPFIKVTAKLSSPGLDEDLV